MRLTKITDVAKCILSDEDISIGFGLCIGTFLQIFMFIYR